MAEPAELTSKFRDVTGVDEGQAKAYLEAAGNDLQVALHHFFGGHGTDEPITVDDEDEDDDVVVTTPNVPTKSKFGETKPKAVNNRFQTVSNLNHDSSSDEEETGQAFFAGGSIHSGQQVLGPPRSRNQIVEEMFRSVKEHGGEVVNHEPGSSKRNTLKFSGTGYRLGQTDNDSEVVTKGESSRDRQDVTVTLKMWRQGFSINDGPLRKYTEPENMMFLKTVSQGVIPDELLRQAQGNEVHLNMEDHSNEEFNIVKPKLKAFSGKGNVLGSVFVTSPVPGAAPPPAPTVASTSNNDQAASGARAREAVGVDATQPTTSVQIRLADGSRLVGTFNHTHTVADLRTYIATARPEYAGASFHLLTTFPSKELTDESATLAAAGILNAALLQRLG